MNFKQESSSSWVSEENSCIKKMFTVEELKRSKTFQIERQTVHSIPELS